MTRIIVLEVQDVQQEDYLHMAVQSWNEQTQEQPDKQLKILHLTSFPTVGS